ncbi:NusG domain II-containing protein [Propionivibrio sp.]|uniref:NusG domain II-containing protein n=1 Tax=Propionivibrio sp. TaxID=2212460 RepID=UPI0025EB5416|nr:NusG domain II-containing protein [Propionivibrio sp.]MBK8402327.1 NusG domain II-containing protein [Propionivibrio sp.]MBK8743487.1 NusG domain II-containing protein [Propionivibrio sp.]MBK8892791.1 NusG domain II-containing protein [Propionivibrio sp.]MBL0206555.1 NusG domain II-containing protein [Propionivibrio sp.]
MRWLALFRPGDWLLTALGLVACAVSFHLAWQGGMAEKAVIKRGGEIFAELDLSRNRKIDVPGPLGVTTISVETRRVRVVSDPGPRQYCVRQGWLSRPGEIAICAPNQVSVQVQGGKEAYDSLSY